MGKNTRRRSSKSPVAAGGRTTSWGTIASVLAILVLAGGVFGYAYVQSQASEQQNEAMAPFVPSNDNKDPSKQIPGIEIKQFEGGKHVQAPRQVAYQQTPPSGGPHDQYWADCTGTVYEQPVRTENIVHSLEHGAVWIAYQPDKLSQAAVDKLRQRVEGKSHMLMSPVPTLDSPISLQSWGHQLKLKKADDPRIDQFITALRTNRFAYPEVGASCQSMPSGFNKQNPPPFQPGDGSNPVPMPGGGSR